MSELEFLAYLDLDILCKINNLINGYYDGSISRDEFKQELSDL
jgi:hypothetical protein